jgi:HAD superfamily hydrolase (TIGR01490 family)
VSDFIPPSPPAGIALFDLDGTLIAWDCQLLFRHFILRREPWRGIFLPVFLAFLPLAGLLGAGGMKRVFLTYLWGMSLERLDRYSREFAGMIMAGIYPQLRDRLEGHRQQGDFLILASASPEFYVKHIGSELGFHLSLGTRVGMGKFFPDLLNHKGAAKVERLRKLLPAAYFENDRLRHSHGYTDSTADLPMLALCHEVTVVNPSSTLNALAETAGWERIRLGRPWKSKAGFAIRVLSLLLGVGSDPGKISLPEQR